MIPKLCILPVLFFVGILNVTAQSPQAFFDEADALFGKYVANGKVDYKALHSNPQTLQIALTTAKNTRVSISKPDEYQAFWINAYNLAVLQGVLSNYPTNSPLDTKGFFDTVKYDVGGQSLTLNDIENKMLRAKFDEPRFHFVLVCGAKGCPPLISQAYRPSVLEKQLQQQTVLALNNDSFIKVTGGEVSVSEIFKWYREDFVKEGKSEINFLNSYRKEKISPNSKLSYYTYDWRLNSK
ncbi:uncharacterized protein DUF547 [Ulvibacter sp. MAR_2010_11]|uniref:DUF547 domain-containing protein n=1 Tax=Ulvibacter sp. MAR_2010_11 TaxID=1250229 RepID=UPI000C2C8589|nr:DUF547 domain-containing protein [Ulvibacter sp. MAR_2010_11]PKA82536.1 uncharacterized protein DUF547 [Ulvibacter sp. MAR_2010_11]